MSVNHEKIAIMRHRTKAFGPLVRERKVNPEITIARVGTVPDYLYQKEVPVKENIRLTSTVEPVTTVVSNTNAGYSSTPDPTAHVEPDSIESDERSEYESSSEEETPEENIIFPQTKVTT